MCYSESTLLHHMALVLQRKYIVTSHGLGVTAKVQCYITWPGCYITWPGCYSERTVLHHMAILLHRCYNAASHRLRVTAKLQCYVTWSECYSEATVLRHMV